MENLATLVIPFPIKPKNHSSEEFNNKIKTIKLRKIPSQETEREISH